VSRAHGRFAKLAVLAMLCLCLAGPSRPAVAVVQCKIWWGTLPGQDPLDRFPTYFSGTRCAVVAEVRTTTPGAMLSWVRVSVGGQQTKYVQLYPIVFLPYVYVQSRFASTHFPDGTAIEVTAEAVDTMGQYGAATPRSSTVYNKATLYGRNEWEQNPSDPSAGVPAARTNLLAMNHSICAGNTSLGWTKADILTNLAPCTAFYVNTHGASSSPYPFMSDKDEIAAPDEWVYPDDVYPVRSGAVGTGYPPFNSGSPPVNLVFIDACWTGLDNAFAEAFLVPYFSAYNQNWCENQSEIGWRIDTVIGATSVVGATFWGALAGGATAHQARDAASRAYWLAIIGDPNYKTPTETISVWGDYHTRLCGLYTYGDTLAQGFWHD